MTNWYAVYTRSRCEKKVAESFARKKWQCYLPHSKSTRQWTGKIVQVPLFDACVFVRVTESQLAEVKKVDGVINLMFWLGKPAMVREIEIEMLQRFLSVHKDVQLEKTAVNPSEMVTLTEAPRVQKEAGVISIGAVGPRLLLPSLGCRLIALQPMKQPNYLPTVISSQQDPLVKFG